MPLQSTGKAFTLRDFGVALLGWLIVLVIIFLIIYLIKYSVHKRKISVQSRNNVCETGDVCKDKFLTGGVFSGIIYIFECISLGISYFFGGLKRPMRTTGKIPTCKEISYCIMGWIIVVLIILSIIFMSV